MLTACFDQVLKEQGIRVAAVHPGKLMTEAGAIDADTSPGTAAVKLADWIQSFDRSQACVCHDLIGDGIIEWQGSCGAVSESHLQSVRDLFVR